MSNRHNLWLVTHEETDRWGGPVVEKVARLVGTYDSYDAALTAHAPLYAALREGRLYRKDETSRRDDRRWVVYALPVLDGREYLAVRDAADPAWQPTDESLSRQDGRRRKFGPPARLFVAERGARGAQDSRDVISRWGNRHGYRSEAGGWIRRSGNLVVQGWHSIAERFMPVESVIQHFDEARHVWLYRLREMTPQNQQGG